MPVSRATRKEELVPKVTDTARAHLLYDAIRISYVKIWVCEIHSNGITQGAKWQLLRDRTLSM